MNGNRKQKVAMNTERDFFLCHWAAGTAPGSVIEEIMLRRLPTSTSITLARSLTLSLDRAFHRLDEMLEISGNTLLDSFLANRKTRPDKGITS